jgi:hypothetical protein
LKLSVNSRSVTANRPELGDLQPLVHRAIPVRFSPEQQLLLCCARSSLDPDDSRWLDTILRSDLDWSLVVAEALRQCMVPLVYRHLQGARTELVPRDVLAQLQQLNLAAAASSMKLAAELRAVAQLLGTHGIGVLPYKGPILALQAYGDIGLRSFSDLDVIVTREDVAAARDVLRTRGYTTSEDLTRRQEAAVLKLEHNLPLVNADRSVLLEVHWGIAPASFSFPFPMDRLWQRSTYLDVGGQPLRAMAIDDLLIVLSVHAARHSFAAVEWISGIAELMRKPGVGWEQVIRDADDYQVGRIVRLAFALAARLLGTPIPDHVARWIEDDARIDNLVAWVAARLFIPKDHSSAAQQWTAFKFEMAVKDGLRGRIRDGLRRLTQPSAKDWGATGLPDALFPLYHAIRPARLLARYLRRTGGR